MQALRDGVDLLSQSDWIETGSPLLIRGDSRLIIQFLTRQANPGRREFVEGIKWVKETIKEKGYKVKYQWVPREENKWADWLGNSARKIKKDVTLG